MRSGSEAVLLAAHQAGALAEIIALCDAGLSGRERATDALLDIRNRASRELDTAAKEAPPWTR